MQYGRYTAIKKIADGASGTIYLATDGVSHWVLKVMQTLDDRERECRIHTMLEGLDCNHLVMPREHFRSDPWLVLVLEVFGGTILEEVIDTRRFLNIALDTARGLVELSNLMLVHDDIKPENVFVKRINGSQRCAYGDFGGVRYEWENPREQTDAYAAPELHKQCGSRTTSSYSWALTMEKIATGKIGVTRCGQSLGDYAAWAGTGMDELLRRCTVDDPDGRPTAHEILAEVQGIARTAMNSPCPWHPHQMLIDGGECPEC